MMRRLSTLLVVAVGSVLAASAARADGPWLVVASQTDSNVTVINLATGAVDAQQKVGTQAVGVASVGSDVAVSDFLGGSLQVYHASQASDLFEGGKTSLATAPELANPEGIVPTGEGGRALISDGGTLAPGAPVGLLLTDLSVPAKLASVGFPSVYGVAYEPHTRQAFVLDGLSLQVAIVDVGAAGTLHDTGARIALHGSPLSPRYVAIDPSAARLLVSEKADGAVEVLDLVTGTSLGRVEGLGVSVGNIAITPDGRYALVAAYGSDWWAVLDLATKPLPTDTGVRIVSPGGVPNTFIGTKAFAFSGNTMYFSGTNSNSVRALDWTTLTMLGTTYPTGVTPAGLDLHR